MEALLLILIAVFFLVYIVYRDNQYEKTAYFQVTKNPYSSIKHDKGKYGEYLIYKRLKHLEDAGGKFLFNLYIPKWGNETTEIDLLLVCSKGLFVFESKNYSGWIFGNERNRYWTQTLPKGRGRSHKERFYNPIMQNATHIKCLRELVRGNVPIQSIIVFSDECTLKDITINSDVRVINRHQVMGIIDDIYSEASGFLTEMEICALYCQLYPYTQLSYEAREQHARNIKNGGPSHGG